MVNVSKASKIMNDSQIFSIKACAETLKKLRKERKLSQIELETSAELCFGTLSRIERVKINPTKETLLKIIYVLNLNDTDAMNLLGLKRIIIDHYN